MIKPQQKFHVKKNDMVYVIAGDYKGLQGAITKVRRKVSRVAIDALPKVKKAVRPTQANPEGGFREIERYIHISNVKKLTEKPAAAKKATKSAAKKK